MTAASHDDFATAGAARESQADQRQYLSPTPPSSAPELDYFALLKSLGEVADPATSDTSLLQLLQGFVRDHHDRICEARLINSSGLVDWFWPMVSNGTLQFSMHHMYNHIEYLRRRLTDSSQEGARVLVISKLGPTLLQLLGAAIDLDPTFLWRHYNAELDSDHYVPAMAKLRTRFYSAVASVKKGKTDTDVSQHSSVSPVEEYCGLHTRGRSSFDKGQMISHVSCYYVSPNSCMQHAGGPIRRPRFCASADSNLTRVDHD